MVLAIPTGGVLAGGCDEARGQLDVASDLYRGYLDRAGPADRRSQLIRAKLGQIQGKAASKEGQYERQ